MTVVAGKCGSESLAMAFCTLIAETPSIPAKIGPAASGDPEGDSTTPAAKKVVKSPASIRRRGRSGVISLDSSATTKSRVAATENTNVGSAKSFARTPPDLVTSSAPIKMKLPVTWDVKRPDNAMKPAAS